MRNLRAALVFLTRIPLRLGFEPSLTSAVPWFPVAGALIGCVVGAAAAGLQHLVPPGVAAAVAVMLGVLVTGAFHEDGLADVADAFGGGWTIEARLRILKDPLHGSYGVAAFCGSIVIRVACVTALGVSPAATFGCLVAAHAMARGGSVAAMGLVPVAREEGLGADYARSLSGRAAAGGVLAAIALGGLATGWWVGPFIAATAVGTAAVVWLAKRKIGGVTGDVLGAIEQINEFLILVVATGLATRFTLWWR